MPWRNIVRMSEEFERQIQRLFDQDSAIIISVLRDISELIIDCTLTANKVFEMSFNTEFNEYIQQVFSIRLANCEDHTFNIFSNTPGKIILTLHQSPQYTSSIFSFTRYFYTNTNPPNTVTIYQPRQAGIDIKIKLPTLREYINNMNAEDLETLISTVKRIITDLPDCMFTGNNISDNQTIVVSLAKSSNKQIEWLVGIYDGSGKQDDMFNAISIQKYLETKMIDPGSRIGFAARPAIFSKVAEFTDLLQQKKTPKYKNQSCFKKYCFIQ